MKGPSNAPSSWRCRRRSTHCAPCATFMRDRAAPDEAPFDFINLINRLLPTLGSQYLANLLVARPMLADALAEIAPRDTAAFYQLMRAAIAEVNTAAAMSDALRRVWHRQVVAIGYSDISLISGP